MNTENKDIKSDVEKRMQKAEVLSKEKKYEEAVAEYKKIVKAHPRHAEAWKLLGNILFELDRYDEAADCYLQVTSIDPAHLEPSVCNNNGNVLFQQRKFPQAIAYYDMAIGIDPNYVWAWRNKGIALKDLRQSEEALKCLKKASEIDPDYTTVWNDIGNIYYDQAKIADALSCYERALRIDPDFVLALLNKGLMLSRLNKIDDAMKCFDKAIEIDPNYTVGWDMRGEFFFNLKKYNEAIKCYERIIEIDPDLPYGYSSKALLLNYLEKKDESKQFYEQALEKSLIALQLQPHSVDLWINRGNCFKNLDNPRMAEQCYSECLKIDPNSVGAMNGLVVIYSEFSNDNNMALELLRRALALAPDDFTTKMNYVEILLKTENYALAKEEGSKLLSQSPILDYEECLIRYFILSSSLLENNNNETDRELQGFIQYYLRLPEKFTIPENRWIFKGLINFFNKHLLNLPSKFLLLTLIDLIQGKTSRESLTFLQTFRKA